MAPPLESSLGLDFWTLMNMEKLSTTPFFIHFVTQNEDHTYCTLRDFKDKESQGKNGHNLHKIMGEFGQGLNIFTKIMF